MGIKTGSGQGNVRFFNINLKEGCLMEGSGATKVKHEAGRVWLEGVPYRLTMTEDEYEGVKSMKANVYMRDADPAEPNNCVSFTVFNDANGVSSQGVTLLGRLLAADTTKPVQIKPWFATAGLTLGNFTFDKEGGHVSLKQQDADGKWQTIRPDFAGRGDQLPPMTETKVPGVPKPVKVKPGWDEILEQVVGALVQRLENENPRQGQQQSATPAAPAASEDIDPADVAGAMAERSAMGARG